MHWHGGMMALGYSPKPAIWGGIQWLRQSNTRIRQNPNPAFFFLFFLWCANENANSHEKNDVQKKWRRSGMAL